jgi:hypothetical protein
MLFMPLAHASTLDRCGFSRCRASSWRRSGARRSRSLDEFAGKSSRHMYSVNYRVEAGEDISLSGGASVQFSIFFKLGITLFRGRRFALQRRGRPSRVALASSCYAALLLAEAPPSEGCVLVEPAAVLRLLPARRPGRGGGRDQVEGVGVDRVQHRLTAPEHSRNSTSAQAQFTKPAEDDPRAQRRSRGIPARNQPATFPPVGSRLTPRLWLRRRCRARG